MNKLALTLIAASFMLSSALYAEETRSENDQSVSAMPAPSVDRMQDNVKKMRSQLERIGKTEDSAERQKLMAEHMQTLHENMMAARGMMANDMGCAMMKQGMGMGMGMGMKHGMGMGMMPPGADGEPMMQRMQQMEKRMERLQMMMEQQMGKSSAQ